ncbi:hypothetical protein QTP88_011440 [Uroleucon formosanum]
MTKTTMIFVRIVGTGIMCDLQLIIDQSSSLPGQCATYGQCRYKRKYLKAYSSINNKGYIHNSVNHQKWIIDPDTNANTQTMECLLKILKKRYEIRLTKTIEIPAEILEEARNENSHKPCPKSKRKRGNLDVGGRETGIPQVASTAEEPPTRVELKRRINAEISSAGAVKNESSKRRIAVSVVKRCLSPIRSPMPALPYPPKYAINHSWKKVPPIPKLKMVTGQEMIRLTWDNGISLVSYHLYATLAGHELFGCVFEDKAYHGDVKWEKLIFVKALPPSQHRWQPISCEIMDMERGVVYYFAVRSVDVHNRRGPFATVYARL